MEITKLDLDLVTIVPHSEDLTGTFVLDGEDECFEHLSEWFREDSITAQNEKKSKTYVAIYKGVIVGFIVVSMHTIKSFPNVPNNTAFYHQMLMVGKLLVVPKLRSNGIGKLLMEFAISIALEIDELTGCIGIFVDANDNPQTLKFYRKLGFTKIGTKNGCVQMVLKVSEDVVVNEELIEAFES